MSFSALCIPATLVFSLIVSGSPTKLLFTHSISLPSLKPKSGGLLSSAGKESTCNVGDLGLDWKDSLEKGMVTHSSIIPWRIVLTV